MSIKTQASWKAHALSTRPGIPSGPTALRMFTRLKDRVTSTTESESGLTSSAAATGAFSVWAVLSASNRAYKLLNNVHSSWFVPFKTCDVVDALPHASCVVGVDLFFNFVFILQDFSCYVVPKVF